MDRDIDSTWLYLELSMGTRLPKLAKRTSRAEKLSEKIAVCELPQQDQWEDEEDASCNCKCKAHAARGIGAGRPCQIPNRS